MADSARKNEQSEQRLASGAASVAACTPDRLYRNEKSRDKVSYNLIHLLDGQILFPCHFGDCKRLQ
jgi:hypothetical protein